MSEIIIKEQDGYDLVQYQPKGVCAKMMSFKVQNGFVDNVEFVGGCNGNLKGIAILVKGMHINEIIPKLSGLPCGSRPTSCPDQLTKALEAYIEAKQGIKV